jgi:hypothetical protein
MDFGDHMSLNPAECAAIGQLTNLKDLYLCGLLCSPPLLQALPQLQCLQELWVEGLPRLTALPALAKLTRLMVLQSRWSADDQPSPSTAVQLTSITVAVVNDAAPLAALPNLRHAYVVSYCQPATIMALSQHCKQLYHFDGYGIYSRLGKYTLDSEAPVAERTAAIASLASLPQLRQLYLAVNDDAEVSALAAVSQLTQLHLVVCPQDPYDSSCSAIGLASLGLLRNMQQLTLYIKGLPLTPVEVRGLLSSLQHVPIVDMAVSPQNGDDVEEGLAMVFGGYTGKPRDFHCSIVGEMGF